MKNETQISYRLKLFLIMLMTASVFMVQPALIVSAAQLDTEKTLKTFLENNYSWEVIEVSRIRTVKTVPLEIPGKIVMEKGPLGNAIFSFFYRDGKQLIVKAHVKAKERVVKSKRPFRKGHLILLEDVYVSTMDIRKMPKSSVKNTEDIVGKSLKKSITANVPIVEEMIEYSPMVKKGKRVVLVINQMGMNIKTAGIIKNNSYIGTSVRAFNRSSKKEVVGILVDANTIKVDL